MPNGDEKFASEAPSATPPRKEHIQALQPFEVVRLRPQMYVGNTGSQGVHCLLEVLLENSVDEAMSGHCRRIQIILHKDGACSVIDDGRGIPVDPMSPHSNKSKLEVFLTELFTGVGISDGYKVNGGAHGIGMVVVSGLSEWLEVEISREGKVHSMSFAQGRCTQNLRAIGTCTNTGTKVTFRPDASIFSDAHFDFERIVSHCREMAFLNGGLVLSVEDRRSGRKEELNSSGGIRDLVSNLHEGIRPIHKMIYVERAEPEKRTPMIVALAMQYNEGHAAKILSYVNSMKTEEGGTHLAGFEAAWSGAPADFSLSSGMAVNSKEPQFTKGFHVGLSAVIAVKIPRPIFEGAFKSKLGDDAVKDFVAGALRKALGRWLAENPEEGRRILLKVQEIGEGA